MQVFIKTLTNDFVIEVEENDTVERLKTRILEKHGIPPERQRLIFSGRELDNLKHLVDYRIHNNSFLHLAVRLCGGVQIFVKPLSGERVDINAELLDTGKLVKIKVHDSMGIPPEHQKLIFAGNLLDDDKTLSDQNVQKDSTVHLVFCLKGG